MSADRIITKSELVKNNGEEGNKLWVLIDGKVYDVTGFNHPGGIEILMEDQENDRFDEFESIHSPAAKRQMTKYLIGTIEGAEVTENIVNEKPLEGQKAVSQGVNPLLIMGIVVLLIAAAVLYLKVLQK